MCEKIFISFSLSSFDSLTVPIAASRTVKLGGTVATVGFPDIGLQGFAPKVLAHGHHWGESRRWRARRMTRAISRSLQTAIPPFEDVVKAAQEAAVLVLVY